MAVVAAVVMAKGVVGGTAIDHFLHVNTISNMVVIFIIIRRNLANPIWLPSVRVKLNKPFAAISPTWEILGFPLYKINDETKPRGRRFHTVSCQK